MLLQSLQELKRRKLLPCKSEAAGARTQDLRIKSPLLYQLSYSLKLFLVK